MGNRNDWTDEQIAEAVDLAYGNLTAAAAYLNKLHSPENKVTRQNLRTWINRDPDMQDAQDDFDAAEILRVNRNLTNTNNELRRQQRHTLDAALTKQETLNAISEAVRAAENGKLDLMYRPKDKPNGRAITIELLFSDIQIGKLMSDYDTEVAKRRVNEWVEVAIDRIMSYQEQGFHIEKIVLAVLGDIIESDKKHSNSGRACDIGTADQIKVGIEVLWTMVISHLTKIAPMDVIMITGNHDHDDHGLNMFMPGREHLSWPLYHAVKMLAEASGSDAKFFIPSGSFHVHEIYGSTILYEHGVGVATSQAAMKKHVGNRIDQLKGYITLFRMG